MKLPKNFFRNVAIVFFCVFLIGFLMALREYV